MSITVLIKSCRPIKQCHGAPAPGLIVDRLDHVTPGRQDVSSGTKVSKEYQV